MPGVLLLGLVKPVRFIREMYIILQQKLMRKRLRRAAAALACLSFLSLFAAPEAEAACPNPSFPPLGNVVELVSCTESKATGTTSVSVSVPAAVNAGDVLLTVVARDDDNAMNVPAGWLAVATEIIDNNDGFLGVYARIADGTEAGSYNWTWGGNEDAYAYMMRFTGASGQGDIGTNSGNGGAAQAPAVTANVDNSLVLRIAGWDRRTQPVDPATIIAGYTTITQDRSRNSNAAVTSAAVYQVQATAGSTGTANFPNSSEQWATVSATLDPIEFRISMPDSNSSVCSSQDVTVSVTDRFGTAMTWFQGTITLSASNATGADWADAGSLNGSLTDLGDGDATYTFSTADNGVATFSFTNPNTGNTNFNIDYGTVTDVENPSFDPDLTITECVPEVLAQNCVAGTSTSITIPAQAAAVGDRGRMVLMAVGLEGTQDVTAASFDGTAMTQIYEEINLNGAGNITELWGILDADLPAAAGTYNGSFTTADTNPSMCLIFLDNANQAFPLPDLGTPANGAVNGSQAQNQQNAVTTITTTDDNALILSLVGNGSGGSDYSAVAPSPPMSRLFDAPDPGGGAEFEGSSGILASQGSITVTETWGGGNPNRHSHVVASFPPISIVPTQIRLAHDGESDVCSVESITISITNDDGAVATDFTGTITISNSAGAGAWTVNDATNALVDNGSGSVDYTFDAADDGEIVLDFQLMSPDAAVDFEVTTTTPGISSPSGADDPLLEVVECTAVLTVNPTSNVCSVSETVSLSILDRDGGVPTGTIGTVVLETDTDNGDYISTSGAGTLDNGLDDDGLATYEFDASDGGVVTFEFSTDTAETLDFSASSTYISFDAGASSETLQIYGCEFRISHSGTADVCTQESVTFTVYNSNGDVVTDYEGVVNLSTDSGNGSWAIDSANGSLVDPVSGDGSATYEFVPADNGTVDLFFSSLVVETINLNVSDGVSSDSNIAADPNLDVQACTFRISLDDGTMSACTAELITIDVYDSGGALATGFTGTVSLSTDTLNGSWADGGGLNGTLTDTTAGDGNASYTFVTADNGSATFSFTNANVETVNINAEAGDISEDGAFDPNLTVTGCIPDIVNSACYPGTGPGTGTLTINGDDPGRMVVMLIWHIDGTPQDVTSATFDGTAMTQIMEVSGGNTAIEMWGILNTDLPAAAGSYAGNYSFDAVPANSPSMCMVEFENVEQVFPAPNLTVPTQGQVNANTYVPDGAPLDMDTTITTTGNNVLVLTAGLSDFTQSPNTWFNAVDPSPPMNQFFFGNNDQNPANGTAGGSFGIVPTAGLFTVTDTDNQDATSSAAHIAASFNPLVAGPPIVSGYVPVELFDTLSGNIAYKAIGNTLRTDSNDNGGACSFVPFGTGTTATLTMPTGSTVREAYLYWAGSGDTGDIDDTVTFGPTGSEISITADEIFQIEGTGGGANLDYFAGYKNVTAQISGNGSYTLRDLVVQNGFPWSSGQGCAGGWSLVVVYQNPKERFRVANIFHGFQPFQNNAFTLVPRNFRMATTDNPGDTPGAGFLPNGEITHITIEGDETLSNGDESLGIQTSPGAATFTTLTNSFNPPNADFNSTVTRPIFADTFGTGFYEFDSTAGLNSDGYEIDQAGPDAVEAGRTNYEIGASWGFDVDTHYIAGNDSSGVLWDFAQPGAEAEQITTRYSSGQDLVMLISEIITVTNFDLADLEVFVTESAGDFKVNGNGQYQYQVVNNGNNGLTGGEATGQIIVANVLPTGMTLDSVSGSGWDCSLTSASGFTCTFDIAADCGVAEGCSTPGQLETAESLPLITANILVGDTSFFSTLSTNVKNAVRMQHNGGACGPLSAGVIPDPASCNRSPQFDNVNDLDGGAIDINDLDDKTSGNNNVHSVVTEVRGVETNLGIEKELVGILEVGEAATYTLTVTNFGPDDTTGGVDGTITVTDAEPAGISFDAASGTGWSCSLGPLTCSYAGVLASGASTTITVDATVTGTAGQNVTNTAAVASGTYNFDQVSGNNSSTDISTIVAPPVSSNERFLLSVSVPGNATEIGGLGPFQNDDYFVYNPLTDEAVLFYDDSGEGYGVNDADAVHLFKNGHIAVSAETSSTIGDNTLAFEPEDIVVWDPILGTATMLFDGSAIFDGPITSNQNIDAVYVKDDGRIVFSTEGPASITFAGPTTVSFNQGDIVEYNPADGSATILVDGSDADIFGAEVQVDGIYVRVDDSDPDLTKDVFILSVDEASTTIGACGSCDPSAGTTLSRDDIVQLDLTGANPASELLFIGDQPLGIFETSDANRTIDAIHTVEDGYIGHFAISQSQAGSTCQAGEITISKHRGLTHALDTDYSGSILISTDIGQGDWSISVGNGTLDNGTADDGAAVYTFVPSDNGQVTLFLTEETESTLNVDVTNGFTPERATEDPNFDYNNVITNVTYRDEWSSASYDNNDGSTFWAGDWNEVDGLGAGPLSGNIVADNSELEMTATAGDPNPSISRVANLSLYSVTETVFLNFDYRYQFLNSGSDVLVVEARANSGDAFTTVQSFSGIGGTNLTPQSLSLDLTTALGSPAWTDTTEIRFRIAGGYTGTSRMFFDNIELATGTTDCGIGAINHYEIRIDGTTGSSSTIVPGLQCTGSVVTITGHDGGDFPAASNEAIVLQTSTGKGDWTLLVGAGSFSNGGLGDGEANYTFGVGETSASFLFNYTDPTTDPELVNFNINTVYGVKATEDPTLSVQQAGLLFYNETADNPTSLSPIPTQIASKPSNVAPDLRLITIEAVRSSDNDPLACTPLFDAGNTLSIGFAGECLDPASCSGSLTDPLTINGTAMTPASNNGGAGTTASYTPIDILMVDQGGGRVGGELVFDYDDVGEIELHAQYQLPLADDINGTLTNDYLTGSSLPFIVRPFGFDIDFSDDRLNNGNGGDSYAADADGTVFATAGVPFDTTVSAIAWQAADDLNSDGVPDDGATLYDNPITPNYGNESSFADYDVLVSLDQIAGPVGGVGTLSDSLFTSFTNGVQTKTMVFDEVGIIDLSAQLVDSADGSTPVGFMTTGVNIEGNVKNVGRFIPADFVLTGGIISSRPLANAQGKSISPSVWTYMGEEFGISAVIQARNGAGSPAITRNYVGAFAKLEDLDFGIDKFFAVDETGAPDDYSSRLSAATTALTINWNSDPNTDGGEATLSGNLIFDRQASGAEDGPYDDITVAVNTTDSDNVGFVLDLDVDGGGNDAATIDTEEFRYGRLLVNNAVGSELEPLGIGFTIEYWNGSEFVVNTDDSSTTLFYNASEDVSANRSILFVPGTFTDNLVEDLDDTPDPGETFIELAAINADSDVVSSFFEGLMILRSGVDSDADDIQDDSPFFTSAPGDGADGSALVEFDLDNPDLPFSLDFLSYDWRGVGETEDINEDGDYDDNPRGLIQFGSYRGHDRVINWQEIYIAPD
jgi:uncharacterized repeat protein (TIGR01451 family)